MRRGAACPYHTKRGACARACSSPCCLACATRTSGLPHQHPVHRGPRGPGPGPPSTLAPGPCWPWPLAPQPSAAQPSGLAGHGGGRRSRTVASELRVASCSEALRRVERAAALCPSFCFLLFVTCYCSDIICYLLLVTNHKGLVFASLLGIVGPRRHARRY